MKGTKGGNPAPVQTEAFLAAQKQRDSDIPLTVELAAKPLSVRVPAAVDEWVRGLPDKNVWLRKIIIEAAEREAGRSLVAK